MGVTSKTCAYNETVGVNAECALGTDYDKFTYLYADTSTSTSIVSPLDIFAITINTPLTVDDSDGSYLNVFLDPQFAVTCAAPRVAAWDASIPDATGLPPFSAAAPSVGMELFVPHLIGGFVLSRGVPMFAFMDKGTDEVRTAQTYVGSTVTANLDDTEPPFASLTVLTMLVDSENKPVAVANVGPPLAGGSQLTASMSAVIYNEDDTFGLGNGATYTSDTADTDVSFGLLRDRLVKSFVPLPLNVAPVKYVVDSGENCDATNFLVGETVVARACLGAPLDVYWARIKRLFD